MSKQILFPIFVLLISMALSACTAANSSSKMEIPVLMYHHISEEPNDWSSATISPDKFKEDMLYLKTLGFQSILPQDLIHFKEHGTPLPENPILITFDDGYKSNYTYAYPILKAYNMKAVINVIVSTVGRDTSLEGAPITPHFSWEEAKEMMDSGLIEIGHHTYDLHNVGDRSFGKGVGRLKNESTEAYLHRLKEDIRLGEKQFEEHLHIKPTLFAYPYGIFTDETEEVLKELGYDITLTVKDGLAPISDSLFLLNRINMPHDKESPALMKKLLKETKRKIEIPFADSKEANKRMEQLEKQQNGL